MASLALRQQPIGGGSVRWATDLQPILALNRQLEETARDLDQHNAFLREENRLKKEKPEPEYRTRLYEQISHVLQPQLERMELLARADDLAAKLPELCLLTTFVKRHSNMELLRRGGSLSAEELCAALAEYNELKTQAADFAPDELAMAQLASRPQKEKSAESRVQAAYGDKYDFWTMVSAKRDVAEVLDEEEPRSIRERLRRKEIEKERINREREPRVKKPRDREWER